MLFNDTENGIFDHYNMQKQLNLKIAHMMSHGAKDKLLLI